MRDKFDIFCELQDKAQECYVTANAENKKLMTLENKCNIPKIVRAVLESDNMEKVQELIEYFRSVRIVPHAMLWLFHMQESVKSGEIVNPKEHEIDYSSFTDEVIAELRAQDRVVKNAFSTNGIAQEKARIAFEEYNKTKKDSK